MNLTKTNYVLIIITMAITLTVLPATADNNRSERQSLFNEIVNINIGPAVSQENSEKVNRLAECIMILQPKHTPFVAKYIASEIVKNSVEKSLDPDLVAAIIWIESQFVPFAASSADAVGLMQVRYTTWKADPILLDNGVDKRSKLFHIDYNISCGTTILKTYYDESGKNISKTLFRYWTGNPNLNKQPWDVDYINKIMYYYFKIREHQLDGAPIEYEGSVAVSPPPVQSTKPATTTAPAKSQ